MIIKFENVLKSLKQANGLTDNPDYTSEDRL